MACDCGDTTLGDIQGISMYSRHQPMPDTLTHLPTKCQKCGEWKDIYFDDYFIAVGLWAKATAWACVKNYCTESDETVWEMLKKIDPNIYYCLDNLEKDK